MYVNCPCCNGSGTLTKYHDCHICDGSGIVADAEYDTAVRDTAEWQQSDGPAVQRREVARIARYGRRVHRSRLQAIGLTPYGNRRTGFALYWRWRGWYRW